MMLATRRTVAARAGGPWTSPHRPMVLFVRRRFVTCKSTRACRHSTAQTSSTASLVPLSSAAAALDPLSDLSRRLSTSLCVPAATETEAPPAPPSPQTLACSIADAPSLDRPNAPNPLRRLARKLARWARSLLDAVLVTARAAEVSAVLSPLLVLTPAAVASSRLFGASRPSDVAWTYTLHSLELLGPAFVKLAQWAATRRDIFPPHVCDRLSELHDRARIHPWSHTHGVLTGEFGDYEARGLRIDPADIIGSGSAAQVYRGTLTTKRGGGEGSELTQSVAVKVLHPNIRAKVERDLLLMRRVASLLDSVPLDAIRMLSLPRAADNFASVLHRQVDLRVEGDNLTKFGDNFSYRQSRFRRGEKDGGDTCVPSTAVLFPRPVDGWVGADVLTEAYVEDARPISDYLRDDTEEGVRVRRELAGPLLRAFLKMVFIDNFVHCDLHPGNVLVRANFKESGDAGESRIVSHTIAFLDAGIAVSLSPNDRRNLRDLFRAVILNEGEEAGRLMVERARYERCSSVEGGVESFSRGVGEIVSEFHDRRKRGLTLGAVRIGALLGRVLDLCRIHGVEIDPAMVSIVVSTLVLEGLGRALEPDLNLLDFALPFVMGSGKV